MTSRFNDPYFETDYEADVRPVSRQTNDGLLSGVSNALSNRVEDLQGALRPASEEDDVRPTLWTRTKRIIRNPLVYIPIIAITMILIYRFLNHRRRCTTNMDCTTAWFGRTSCLKGKCEKQETAIVEHAVGTALGDEPQVVMAPHEGSAPHHAPLNSEGVAETSPYYIPASVPAQKPNILDWLSRAASNFGQKTMSGTVEVPITHSTIPLPAAVDNQYEYKVNVPELEHEASELWHDALSEKWQD